MGVVDLFSKRQKRLRGEMPDVYQYDTIPGALRVQIVHVIADMLVHPTSSPGIEAYRYIHDTLCREYGVFTLHEASRETHAAVENFVLEAEDGEGVLDVVELAVSFMASFYTQASSGRVSPSFSGLIAELNQRFQEHGVGYRVENLRVIRVDSEVLHAETVKPALSLLHQTQYQGADEEYRHAHEHYRHGRYKECLVDCLKAMESVLKTICQQREWNYAKTDTAKRLLDICLTNGLIPDQLQSHFSALRATLEGGVPTLRNKMGGHGQGSQPVAVLPHVAAYALHLTASNIVLLVEAEKALP